MNEKDTKFFRPLWIRMVVTAIVAIWFVLEVALSHDPLWMTVTGVGVAYCLWNFFLHFPRHIAPAQALAPGSGEEPPPPAA